MFIGTSFTYCPNENLIKDKSLLRRMEFAARTFPILIFTFQCPTEPLPFVLQNRKNCCKILVKLFEKTVRCCSNG